MTKVIKFYGLCFCMILISNVLYSQDAKLRKIESGKFVQHYFTILNEQQEYVWQIEDSFTSLVVAASSGSFDGAYIVNAPDTFFLTRNEHLDFEKDTLISDLVVFNSPQQKLTFHRGNLKEEIKLILINASGGAKVVRPSNRQLNVGQEGCEKPVVVPQSEWRKGLKEPSYERSFTVTEHLIVHHSATSNSLTDYVNVVRNIYVYHTEGNGWSDIGYNYLIAPNGVIFAGRDPGVGEQDFVLGAHFCGKNRETMGVCMIGDYSNTNPTLASLNSLEYLLSWKAAKDDLNPLVSKYHPANPTLPVIAGHRDGCSTTCPGDGVYSKLPAMRVQVADKVEDCDAPVAQEIYVSFNSIKHEICINNASYRDLKRLRIFDVQGKSLDIYALIEDKGNVCFSLKSYPAGLYIINVESVKGNLVKKVLLL